MSRLFSSDGQSIEASVSSISPSKEYSGFIFFRIDWLDHFAFKGPPQSFLKHHSLKASVLRCSLFFTIQVSHPLEKYSFDYMDLGPQSNVSAF